MCRSLTRAIQCRYLPHNRGFDSSFGYLGGGEKHFTQRCDQAPGGIFPPNMTSCAIVDLWNTSAPAAGRNGTYSAFLYTNEAVRIIRNHSSSSSESNNAPLFLYYAAQETYVEVCLLSSWSSLTTTMLVLVF